MACRENIVLRQIKQRNTNLLAGEFAGFDHKFRPRLRRPYFNSFARDTQSILVFNSGALARAKRARSGAPRVKKFGKLSIRENLVMT